MKVAVIHDTIDHITELAVEESSARLIPPNSILFVTRSGILEHTFPVAQSAVPVTVNQDIKALTPAEPLNPGYIAWGARAFEYEILQRCSKDGTTVASVDTTLLQAFPLPVAPVPEQHRIVEAIESYLTRLDDTTATLERLQRNLKRYRASVLKAAVEGRLVPSEAELARMERREYEPPSELLERILAERRHRWEEAELSKMQAKGTVPKNDKWKAKYVEPAEPDTSELPELPEGWCWTSACQLSQDTQGAISAGPFGTIFKAKDFRPTGVPIIQIRHVKPDRFLTHGQTYMDERIWEDLFRDDYSVFGGELLITKLGDPPGDCAIFPGSRAPSMLTPDVIKLEVNERLVIPRYVMHYINSTLAKKYTFGAAFGTTRLRLTLAMFREMPIPVSPLSEQLRIAEAIDRLLTVTEDVNRSVQNDMERIQRLRQSILKWAFEGRLVDQDPNDEPASVLLERIQAERAASKGKNQSRTRPVNTKSVSA
jgi:type I restriction enzyme S subunit